MQEQFKIPGIRLSNAISHFYIVKGSMMDSITMNRLAPNYEVLLILNFGPKIRLSLGQQEMDEMAIQKFALLGPLKKTLNYELLPGSDFIVVNFTLNGFYRLFHTDLNKISECQLVNPDTILGHDVFGKLWKQLSESRSTQKRITLLKRTLHKFLITKNLPFKNGIIDNKLDFDNDFVHPVKAISRMLGKSERTVQLRFNRQFGYSTKERMRFNRFYVLLKHLIRQEEKTFNWVQLALQFGYYDQSHMLKDFNQFLGLSPKSFIKDRERFCIGYQSV